MKFLRFVLFAVFSALALNAQARTPEAVGNYPAVAVVTASGKTLSAEQIKQTTRKAAEAKNWVIGNLPDGKMVASFSWRGNKHTISVEIGSADMSYSINYKDSINMKYEVLNGQPTIHPFYNRYVKELKTAIDAEFMKL